MQSDSGPAEAVLERGDKAKIARRARVSPPTVTMVLGAGLNPGRDKKYGKASRNVWKAYRWVLAEKVRLLVKKRERLILRLACMPAVRLEQLLRREGVDAQSLGLALTESAKLADAILAQRNTAGGNHSLMLYNAARGKE